MQDYPFHCEDPWHSSYVEDYCNAKNDEERRRMLILFGYDDAHYSEVLRLFDEK